MGSTRVSKPTPTPPTSLAHARFSHLLSARMGAVGRWSKCRGDVDICLLETEASPLSAVSLGYPIIPEDHFCGLSHSTGRPRPTCNTAEDGDALVSIGIRFESGIETADLAKHDRQFCGIQRLLELALKVAANMLQSHLTVESQKDIYRLSHNSSPRICGRRAASSRIIRSTRVG